MAVVAKPRSAYSPGGRSGARIERSTQMKLTSPATASAAAARMAGSSQPREDGSPVRERDQAAAEQRAGRHPGAAGRGPPADQAVPGVLVGCRRGREEERAGQQECGPGALHEPGEVEHQHRACERADRGRRGEEHEPGEERPFRAEGVGDRAGAEHERGERQGVGIQRPLQLRTGPVQMGGELRERDVHDRAVDENHERGDQRQGDDGSTVFDSHGKTLDHCST
jgi:hypothetical protein